MQSLATPQVDSRLISGSELYEMDVPGPCELVEGRIVPVSPTGVEHADIESRLNVALSLFLRERELGRVLVGEIGIYTRRNPDSVRAADVVVISKERLPAGRQRGFLEVAPELVIEIMSPSDRWLTVRQKLEEYFSIGVDRVWIVEPDNRAVLVFHSSTGVQKLDHEETILGEGILEGFTLPVADLFGEYGEDNA
jgi:Uma2 family endonuclease